MEAAKALIKKMADQRYDLTMEQREQLKIFVDIVLGVEKAQERLYNATIID